MQLLKEEIVEFKQLILEIFGIELTDEQAIEQASRLIQLFELEIRLKKLAVEIPDEEVGK